MKVLGYCESCHRFKYVWVGGAAMAKLAMTRVAHGICDSCEQKEDERRKQAAR